MKTIKKIMMAMFVMACVGLTVSCNKDDDNSGTQGGGDNNYSTLIVGTWQIDEASSNEMDITSYLANIRLSFNANGTGLMNDGGQTQNNGFSWTISGNTITVVTTHHGVQMEFTINSMTSTECSFSGAAMELDGHMMENVVIHMVKVGDEPTPDPDPDPQPDPINRDLLLGTWQINSMLNNGQDMTEMASQLHIKIHLEEDGSGVISIAFQEYPFTWTLAGNVLNINAGNETINATIISQTADQIVFTSNNMTFPGMGGASLPGETTITLIRYNGDEPGPNPEPNPDPVTGELTGTSWGYNYSGTMTEAGQTVNYTVNMLLAFTTSTTGTLTETMSAMGYSDTENINFTYIYDVNSHSGTMTATTTDPRSGESETQTLPFTYNLSTNTISVTNPDPEADEGFLPRTLEFYRISK